MGVSQNYLWDHYRKVFNSETSTYSTLKYAALVTSSESIPPNATLSDVELAFADLKTCGVPTIQPFVRRDPEDTEDPEITPEILPFSEYPAPGTWTNDTDEVITVNTLAVVSGDDLLFWGEVRESDKNIDPGEDYAPSFGIVLTINRIVPEFTPSLFSGTDAIIVPITYETANEREAAKHVAATVAPHQLQWADWISGDPTIGVRFKKAVEQLERLIFAIDGAPCEVSGQQWYHSKNVRCNWFAEVWEDIWCGTHDGFGEPICGARYYDFHEYAALGQSSHGIPQPTTPKVSRSGDWRYQMVSNQFTHDSQYYPKLSVTRDDGTEVFDPLGNFDPYSGDYPGDEIAGEAVTITYTVPEGKDCTSASLTYNATTVSMTGGPTVWTYDIPAQNHNVEVSWSISATFDTDDGEVTVRDPLTGSYTYTAFSHVVIYPHGFPSFYHTKDTDQYEFDGNETVQYQLINMMRFILDYYGQRFQHSPDLRSTIPACCLLIPIKFRWSGANKYPLHRNDGKSGVAPLHNLQDVPSGSDGQARRSWRGYPYQYADNRYYPSDAMEASWLPPNGSVTPLQKVGSECVITWAGENRGLQQNDMIEPVHVEELISAVDYLINNGLWNKCPIKRNPTTPSGLGCGEFETYYDITHYTPDPGHCAIDQFGHIEVGLDHRYMCFESCTEYLSWSFNYTTCMYDITGSNVCTPYAAPDDWQDCWDSGSSYCTYTKQYHRICSENDGVPDINYHQNSYTVTCIPGLIAAGGEIEWTNDELNPGNTTSQTCDTSQKGWIGYVCGPDQTPNGDPEDSNHGNDRVKPRTDHTCPDPDSATSTIYSIGNKLGAVKLCATNYSAGDWNGTNGMDFETVQEFFFAGWENFAECDPDICTNGFNDCFDCNNVDPPLGYNSWWSWAATPARMCTDTCEHFDEGFEGGLVEDSTSLFAQINVSECNDDTAWCSIDLNIAEGDEDLMPNLHSYNLSSSNLVTECPCQTHGNGDACV